MGFDDCKSRPPEEVKVFLMDQAPLYIYFSNVSKNRELLKPMHSNKIIKIKQMHQIPCYDYIMYQIWY